MQGHPRKLPILWKISPRFHFLSNLPIRSLTLTSFESNFLNSTDSKLAICTCFYESVSKWKEMRKIFVTIFRATRILLLLNLKRFIFTESILRKLQFSFFYFFRYFIQCFMNIDQLMTWKNKESCTKKLKFSWKWKMYFFH